MMEKFKEHKLHIAIIVVVGCLIFYAVGNATGFFGNPAFRMFWILSDDAARNFVPYVAIAGAVAVVVIGLTVNFMKKRKTIRPQATLSPFIPSIKTTNQMPVKATLSTITKPQSTNKTVISSYKATGQIPVKSTLPNNMPKTNDRTKENKIEQKNEPIKQSISQRTQQPAAQKTILPNTNQNKTNSQKTDTNRLNETAVPFAEQNNKPEKTVTETIPPKEKTLQDNDDSIGCHYHYFGYLSERQKGAQIPEECLSCKNILECMLRKMMR
jgi:hypothetical protein